MIRTRPMLAAGLLFVTATGARAATATATPQPVA